MDQNIYAWKRFWCNWEGNYLLTDDGYLLDPEVEPYGYRSPDVVSFQDISHNHCLVLLGEPGIGKTSAIKMEEKLINSKNEISGSKSSQNRSQSNFIKFRFYRNSI